MLAMIDLNSMSGCRRVKVGRMFCNWYGYGVVELEEDDWTCYFVVWVKGKELYVEDL